MSRVTPYNVGRFVLSEDACIASCLDFRAYEQGVSDAADAFGRDPLNTHAPKLLAALEAIVNDVIAANEKSVEQYRAGKEAALNSLIGQAMKASKGKANPGQVNELLKKKLEG